MNSGSQLGDLSSVSQHDAEAKPLRHAAPSLWVERESIRILFPSARGSRASGTRGSIPEVLWNQPRLIAANFTPFAKEPMFSLKRSRVFATNDQQNNSIAVTPPGSCCSLQPVFNRYVSFR